MNTDNLSLMLRISCPLDFRSIICASSQGGKGILLQNLNLKICKNCFENWIPVKRYITDHLKVDNDKERYLLDDCDSTALQNIINTQNKVIEYEKKNKIKHLFSVLIVIDDFAEDRLWNRAFGVQFVTGW